MTHFHYDAQLWRELEYLISDMNAFATHLLQYLIAKVLCAETRCFPLHDETMRRDRLSTLLAALGLSVTTVPLAIGTLLSLSRDVDVDKKKCFIAGDEGQGEWEGTAHYRGGALSAVQGEEIRAFFASAGSSSSSCCGCCCGSSSII